jgi:hypothetical protein
VSESMSKVECALADLRYELSEFVDAGGSSDLVADAILQLIDARVREVVEGLRAELSECAAPRQENGT